MKVIGITGGVGSGKSAVLAWMEQEYGACICQMDEVAKQLQKKGTECFGKNWVKWYSQVRKNCNA